jgi:hypothetical protein
MTNNDGEAGNKGDKEMTNNGGESGNKGGMKVTNLPSLTTYNPLAPADMMQDPFMALALSLERPDMDGEILKFNRGRWSAGKDGERRMDGVKLVACVDGLTWGWRKWVDKRIVDQRLGLIANGSKPHIRAELGDMDEDLWPLNSRGEANDPWQFGFFLQLLDLEDRSKKFVWPATSFGARKEIGVLSKAYAQRPASNARPVVMLEAGFYRHKDYGRVDTPELNIVGWVGEETPAPDVRVSAEANNDLNDEISL